MFYIFPLLAVLLSFLFSFVVKKIATKNHWGLQKVRTRDLHTKPVPRLGGVAIVLSFLIVMILAVAFAPHSATDFNFPFAAFGVSIDKRLLGIIVATVFLSIFMLFDDLKGIRAYSKLLAQILSAVILVAAGAGITYLNNPFGLVINLDTIRLPIQIGQSVYHFVLWADLFFIIWTVILTNATNFIDGLDGLAGTLCLISAIAMVFLSLQTQQLATALLAAVFAGSIIGFLPFNLPRASLMLGDTGSMFLGLMLAVLTVISGGKLATLLLVFGLVIIDAIYVILKRLIKGKNPLTTADQSHLHHRFLKAGFSQVTTLITIAAISIAFGLVGLLTSGRLKIELIGVLVIFTLVMFFGLDREINLKFKITNNK